MVIALLIIGIICLIFGWWISYIQHQHKNKTNIQNDNLAYLNQMQKKEIDQNTKAFLEQFELTQGQLENLYAQDFSRFSQKFNDIDHHLHGIETKLDVICHQLSCVNSILEPGNNNVSNKEQSSNLNILAEDDETVVAPNINFNSDIALKLEQLIQLQKSGLKVEEIAKRLEMGKGEVLLLNNLLKK